MNRFCTTLMTFSMLLALSAPAWAQGTSHSEQPYLTKNDTHYGHYHPTFNKHQIKVLKQFRELKKTYSRSVQDARQMFLEFLGSSLPSSDTDIQKIREEYEQQIAQLNATIASQQQQLADLNGTIASQQQQLTDLNATIQSQQQQMDALAASHQAAQDDLALQMTQQCNDQMGIAFNDGKAEGMATCLNTGPAGQPQPVNSWSTDTLYPYALDVDGSGNTFALDKNARTIAVYDGAGSLTTQWASNTLSMPVDIAVDSNGDVYVLDQSASVRLQKYSPDGQLFTTFSPSESLSNPTGLFIDNSDTIYVTDLAGGAYGGRILMFDTSGAFQGTLGEVPELSWEEYLDVAVDELNHLIYVVTRYNLIAKFDMNGNFISAWGDSSNLRYPNSIAVGAQGQVFVADTYNNQIDQYDTDGNLMYSFDANGELYRPRRIVADATGRLFIADESNRLIRIYQ